MNIDRSIAEALAKLAQQVYDQHGIKLNAASLEWMDDSSVGGEHATVTEVRVDLTARA